jgi:hypothetical protein
MGACAGPPDPHGQDSRHQLMGSRAHVGASIAWLDSLLQDWGWRQRGPERVSLLKEDPKVGTNQVLRDRVLERRLVLKKDGLALLSRGPTGHTAA